MDFNLESAEVILNQFVATSQINTAVGSVHGIDVVLHKGRPAIRLCIEEKAPADTEVTVLAKLPSRPFAVKIAGSAQAIEVITERLPIPTQQFSPGGKAQPVGAVHYGTAGWNFYLNDAPTVMSNWHVLCDNGNSTPQGRRIQLDGSDIAALASFVAVDPSKTNQWDLAYARLDHHSQLSAFMRTCSGGCPPGSDNCTTPLDPIPSEIIDVITGGLRCRKIGARDPVCRYGSILGFGNRRVNYEEFGFTASFEGQVILSKMTDKGDSGAVIFAFQNGLYKAVALNFAGSDQETIANPLTKLGLQKVGDRNIPGTSLRVPDFRM